MTDKTVDSSAKARTRWLLARRIVQFGALLLFLLPLIVSGWALLGLTAGGDEAISTPADLIFYGTLSSSQIAGINLLDPFGVLQLIAASKAVELDWLIFALPVVIVYGLLGARVFCGWVCPTNLLLEFVDFLRKKLHINVKEHALPRYTKIGVAVAVIVLSLVLNVPFFESFSPISAVNKALVVGSTAGLLTLLAVIVMELFWGHRVWCRSLCPLGGFYELIGRVGFLKVRIDYEACIHCDKCKQSCLADPEILDPVLANEAEAVYAGDCMLCGKCIDVCPTQALSAKFTPKVK